MQIEKFKEAFDLKERADRLNVLKIKIEEVFRGCGYWMNIEIHKGGVVEKEPIHLPENREHDLDNKEDIEAINEFIDQRIEKLKQEFNAL